MRIVRFFVLLILSAALLIWAAPVHTQDSGTCPAVIDEAVTFTSVTCADVGRNQACYGNLTLTAQPQPDVTDFTFANPGDIEDLIDIASLTLNPFETQTGHWGVALLKLQANLPDTVPGQNVTILLFGDAEMVNAVDQPAVTVPLRTANNLNVRSRPSERAAILTSLRANDIVIADGRLEHTEWLRIQLPDGRQGWVSALFVLPEGDVDALPVREPDDTSPALRPMQAFYFRSGPSSAACAGRIESGLIVQTPGSAREIVFSVNEVNIKLGTTVVLQTPGDQLVIQTVKGRAEVTAQGKTQIVPVGYQVSVPIDANKAASGPPDEPQPITDSTIATLPFDLLPIPVDVSDFVAPVATPEAAPAADVTPEAAATAESTPPVGDDTGPLPPGSGTVPTGEAMSVLLCSMEGQKNVPAGQPLILRLGWVAADSGFLGLYLDSVTNTLTFDGQVIPVTAVQTGSFDMDGTPAVVAQHYWQIPSVAAGSHQVSLTMTLPGPIPDGFDADEDGVLETYGGGTFSCTIVAE